MSVIGRFEKQEGGAYSGFISTLLLRCDARFEHRAKGANFAILSADGCELGAAWRKSGEWGDYLSIKMDCPALPAPVNAMMSLTPSEDGYYFLRWQRRETGRDGQ